MSTTFSATFGLGLTATLRTVNSDNAWPDVYQLGSAQLPAWSLVLADGSGANKAQKHYHRAHTIAASDSVTIDLNAAVTESLGTLDFASIKTVLIRLRSPAAGKKVVIGNVTNQWNPWMADANGSPHTTLTEDVYDLLFRTCPVDAWTVPGAAVLKISNPGASSVIVDVSLTGN